MTGARHIPVVNGCSLPGVAVVVATCNRPGLLVKRSLAAILSQTRCPDYLLVVDDSDAPVRPRNRTVVDQLHLPNCRIAYLCNSRMRGASGAWNTGLQWLGKNAGDPRAVFVAILDDDDEWEPDHLENCTEAAMLGPFDMVAASILRITGADDKRPKFAPKYLDAGLFLVGNPHIQGSNLFVRFSALLAAGMFDESLESCTDRDLCIRLADLGWVRYCGLSNITVKHFAEPRRWRLSYPKGSPKRRGLDRFWLKWNGRMSPDQRRACLERAKTLFGWEPAAELGDRPMPSRPSSLERPPRLSNRGESGGLIHERPETKGQKSHIST